jgi:MFS family permease
MIEHGRAGILRFVSLGAVGFGVGGAIAAASWPLLMFTFGASALLFVLSGAVGGASLGLALGDRRRTLTLALLGILGTLIGGILALVIAFLYLASEEALYGVRGAMGVFGGAVVGASLGLAFRDWKRVLVLMMSGAVGFGAGIVLGVFLLRTAFGEDFMAGTPGTIMLYAITGLVGGALLGGSLGYVERVTLMPRGQTTLRLAALASVPLIGGLLAVGLILPQRSVCDEEERAAFSEFPQYGGVEKDPRADSESGGCALFYNTSAPPAMVAAYLAGQLEAHGWKVEHRLEAKGDGSDQFSGTLVTAHRDGLRYDVVYESLEFYKRPRPGTHVAVHVFEDR